jgi:hypothetical protein
LTRIVLRDLDHFPDLLMPVVDRLLDGPIRTVADRVSAAAPGIDGQAMATLLIGDSTSSRWTPLGKRRWSAPATSRPES